MVPYSQMVKMLNACLDTILTVLIRLIGCLDTVQINSTDQMIKRHACILI